jgi:hypothetical protein
MWRRTRNGKTVGPNELMVRADAARLRAWRAWLRRCRLRPELAWTDSPVVGAWQILFWIRNFAPALQKLVLEEREASGNWRVLSGLFTIEFRARSARPKANVIHQFSAPVRRPPRGENSPPLRISLRGLGQIKVGGVVLTNGVERHTLGRDWRILGVPPPRIGFPDFDFETNRGEWELDFAD